MTNYCGGAPINSKDANTRSFYVVSIFVSVVLVLQLALLIHTIGHYKKFSNIKKSSIISYFLLQFSGLFWTINGLFRYCIVPLYFQTVVYHSLFCIIWSYTEKITPFIYQSIVLSILIMRLDSTFIDSQFAIQPFYKYIVLVSIAIIYCSVTIIFFIFLGSPCIRLWKPYDYNPPNQYFAFCVASFSGRIAAEITAYIATTISIIANLSIGFYFSYKLSKFNQTCCDAININEMRELIQKNTILTISIAVSTLICYILVFLIDNNDMLHYLDCFLNSLFVGLMFKFNKHIYYKLFFCDNVDCRRQQTKEYTELSAMKQPSINKSQKRYDA